MKKVDFSQVLISIAGIFGIGLVFTNSATEERHSYDGLKQLNIFLIYFIEKWCKFQRKNLLSIFFYSVVLSTLWWRVTRKVSDTLNWLPEDPSNFVEVLEKEEADDEVVEADDTDAEETN